MARFIVFGPPAGGKTTFVRERIGENDLVVDVDSLNQAITWREPHHRLDSAKDFIFAMRALLLGLIEREGFDGDNVWVISSAPRKAQRAELVERIGGELVAVVPDKETCHERARADGRPPAWHKFIDEWFDRYEPETRTTPQNKRGMKPEQKNEVRYFTAATIDRSAVDEEARTVELAFSSETPVDRPFGREVLDHTPDSVDLSRLNDGAPLLLEHDRSQQVGVIESARVDVDRIGRAVVRFSKSALGNEIFQDVKDGIRRLVSVGYTVGEFANEKAEAGLDTLRAINWQPLEISLVSIPADATVGVGRHAEKPTDSKPITEPKKMNEEKIIQESREAPKPDQPQPKAEPEVRIEVRADKRATEIAALGQKFEADREAVDFIAEGKSADDFKTYLMERNAKAEPIAKPEADLGLNERERKSYSLVRAIRNAAETGGRVDGFELEISQEIAKRSGREPQGFYAPNDVLGRMSQRDLTTGVDADGGFLVETGNGEYIDPLTAAPLVVQLGARVMSGLSGNVNLPQGGTATAYWTAENAAATESTPTIGQLSLSPNRVAAYSEISKQLLAQASYDVEGIIRDDLNKQLSLAIDKAAIQGSGSSNEPTGITNTSGINTVTMAGAAPAYADVVDIEAAVETDNALAGSLAYIMTPADKATLRKTSVDSGSGRFIMEGSDLNGYRAEATTQSPATTLIFGNFSDLIVAEWGSGVDLVVDPYSLALTGLLRVHVSRFADVGVRHAVSFCSMATA